MSTTGTKVKQKEAVFAAVTSVKKGNNTPAILSQDEFNQIVNTISQGILNGTVKFNKDATDSKAVTKYSRTLVKNWLNRDTRLNGIAVSK